MHPGVVWLNREAVHDLHPMADSDSHHPVRGTGEQPIVVPASSSQAVSSGGEGDSRHQNGVEVVHLDRRPGLSGDSDSVSIGLELG